ncbi:acyl-CoA dehydrogenase family protein [Embleya scabrispora]|uniref:acyl-CoA dehydrogenase family protein n=1 Tax=Embleya scabrispora TaxID=159449 RepID=UPI00037D8CD8|nr:acyl-CoA dehydrogenase family protein [Embleya scabrispora]MYS85508.1 acyl-CoA dehydrogenase [Streptomyces sp. SID5474]
MDVSRRDEVAEFTANAAALITRHWGRADAAPTGDLDRLWDVGAVHGWFDLGDTDALVAAIALVRALGRAACPLPVLDAFVAARLFAANTGLAGAIGDGGIRVVTALPGVPGEADVGADCLIEAGDAATHVLRLPFGGGPVGLYRILAAEPVEGLAVPKWSRARLGAALAYGAISADRVDRMVTLLRLGLAVRAFGAAERAAASEPAGAGIGCGARVGAFAAGRPRAEHGRIELDAGDLLITDAVRRYAEGGPDWVLAAELAVAHVRRVAPRVRVDVRRPPPSAGCSDEHEAPWLFRRVHADLACLGAFGAPGGEVADRLLEADPNPDPDAGIGLPELRLGPDGDALREAVRKALAGRPRPRPAAAGEHADDPATVAEFAEHGWFALDWSAAHGGSGGTPAERFALRQEVCRHRLPVADALACAAVFGAAIARHGTPEQRERLLPGIRRGTLRIAPAYRTARADFDPAAVRVRAARADGDRGDWILTGDRLWSADAHRARYVWLAARTGPDHERPQAGLTVFLVPVEAPGVTVRPHRSPAGERGCAVLLDRVRVADTARIGAVDGGWSVIVDTFAAESIVAGDVAATLHRGLVDLIGLLRTGPEAASAAGPRGSAARAGLTELAVRVQAIRLLAATAAIPARAVGDGTPRLHALAARVLGGELAADFGALVLDLLGPAAALGAGTADAQSAGVFGSGPRRSAADTFGGTGDLHRGLLARALGLPVRV